MQHRDLLEAELVAYMVKGTLEADNHFYLLHNWARRATPTVVAGTNDVALFTRSPHLTLLALLYHSIDTTSCQAKTKFSALSLLISELRMKMTVTKVEHKMFILNVYDVYNLVSTMCGHKDLATASKKDVAQAQTAAASNIIEMSIKPRVALCAT